MRTLRLGTVLAGLLYVAKAVQAQSAAPSKLIDIYASRSGEDVIVHVVASGDISGFKTTRKLRGESYTLTLDIPALPPVNGRYDVRTPFTRRFELWPMKLGVDLGCRLVLELETAATSVIGAEGSNHVFIKISRESAQKQAAGSLPEPEPPPSRDGKGDPPVAEAAPPSPLPAPGASESVEDTAFFNLFPTSSRGKSTPAPSTTEGSGETEAPDRGWRLGRFAFVPTLDVAFISGSNLLLASAAPFEDRALLVRGRAAFELLDSEQALKLGYETRYRRFGEFELESTLTHFLDVKGGFTLTPRLYLDLSNHLVRGSFESDEVDPGHELALNVDPFVRNDGQAALTTELSERLGIKVRGRYNRLQFLEDVESFFSYQTAEVGASFLYNLSPVTTLYGEYARTYTPEPAGRLGAGFTGDNFFAGLTGEITARMVGTIEGGYSQQDYGAGSYRGLIAQANLTRQLTEGSTLRFLGGRQNFLSAFANNTYYTSNHGQVDLVASLPWRLTLVGSAFVFDNRYPLVQAATVRRKDLVLSGRAGIGYSLTSFSFVRFDYRHERRASSLDGMDYRNNTIVVLLGLGYPSN